MCSFSASSRPTLASTQPPAHLVHSTLFPGLKRTDCLGAVGIRIGRAQPSRPYPYVTWYLRAGKILPFIPIHFWNYFFTCLLKYLGFDVLTALARKVTIFRDMTPFSQVDIYLLFMGAWYPILQGVFSFENEFLRNVTMS